MYHIQKESLLFYKGEIMEQRIVRSYQNGMIDSHEKVNILLSEGFVVAHSTVIPPSGDLNGYIEYVLERHSIPRGVEND